MRRRGRKIYLFKEKEEMDGGDTYRECGRNERLD